MDDDLEGGDMLDGLEVEGEQPPDEIGAQAQDKTPARGGGAHGCSNI
jgi:hypothetical protein